MVWYQDQVPNTQLPSPTDFGRNKEGCCRLSITTLIPRPGIHHISCKNVAVRRTNVVQTVPADCRNSIVLTCVPLVHSKMPGKMSVMTTPFGTNNEEEEDDPPL